MKRENAAVHATPRLQGSKPSTRLNAVDSDRLWRDRVQNELQFIDTSKQRAQLEALEARLKTSHESQAVTQKKRTNEGVAALAPPLPRNAVRYVGLRSTAHANYVARAGVELQKPPRCRPKET